jgi:hypothetical protein
VLRFVLRMRKLEEANLIVSYFAYRWAGSRNFSIQKPRTLPVSVGTNLSSTFNSFFQFTMIKPEERFMSDGQGYFGSSENPKTVTHCNVWDWDQLRMIKVKGTAKLFPPSEDIEVLILARFADYLSPEVRAVTVDDEGLISEVSTDLKEDDTMFIGYLGTLNCKNSIGLDQVLTYQHTTANPEFLKRLPLNSILLESLEDCRWHGMNSTYLKVCRHIQM